MDIQERSPQDRQQLGRLIRNEPDAKQRDRYRAAALALDGRLTEEIVEMLDQGHLYVCHSDGALLTLKMLWIIAEGEP